MNPPYPPVSGPTRWRVVRVPSRPAGGLLARLDAVPGSPLRDATLAVAGDPAAVLVLAAAVEVPADATRTMTLWYAAVALLGLVVLLAVALLYGRRRR